MFTRYKVTVRLEEKPTSGQCADSEAWNPQRDCVCTSVTTPVPLRERKGQDSLGAFDHGSFSSGPFSPSDKGACPVCFQLHLRAGLLLTELAPSQPVPMSLDHAQQPSCHLCSADIAPWSNSDQRLLSPALRAQHPGGPRSRGQRPARPAAPRLSLAWPAQSTQKVLLSLLLQVDLHQCCESQQERHLLKGGAGTHLPLPSPPGQARSTWLGAVAVSEFPMSSCLPALTRTSLLKRIACLLHAADCEVLPRRGAVSHSWVWLCAMTCRNTVEGKAQRTGAQHPGLGSSHAEDGRQSLRLRIHLGILLLFLVEGFLDSGWL